MRILTVRQPWAYAIIHGGKDVENRTTNIAGAYRGPVAIHVGLRYDYDWRSSALDAAMRPVRNDFARRALTEVGATVRHPMPWEEGIGHIIGVVDLVDVHNTIDCWGFDGQGERWCSAWAQHDMHHLVLANPRPLSEPIPYRGALGLRRLDEATISRIEAQL